jgi:prepilin-type N-terminal cleavage/methylation domain-containing protein
MSRLAAQPQVVRRWSRRATRGFTLIETAMATVIIGVAFTAMLQLLAAGTVANRESTQLTTAINLAGNIHEAAIRTGYGDLFDLEGTHSPAVDAQLVTIPGMPGWSQVVDVCYVDESLITQPVPDTQYEPTARVTVTVRLQGKDVYTTSWIAAASE